MNHLTLEQIKTLAPAVFAERPSSHLTTRYQFLPTNSVVEALMDKGAKPVFVTQRRSRTEGRRSTTKHFMRFDMSSVVAPSSAGDRLEITMLNSHDGMSSYRFNASIHRPASGRSAFIATSTIGDIRMRHTGEGFRDGVTEVVKTVVDHSAEIYSKIEAMRSRILTPFEKMILARDMARVRWKDETIVDLKDILTIRRDSDNADDLWTVYNVITENILIAGFYGRNTRNPNKFRRMREVKAVDAVYNYSRSLFAIADRMV